ncbi:MAG TPA: alcohol dehydrogenase catalytic domain-containing protein [Solirubrobacteraceae bacterium]|nr:alcohol dehydrogenase catalytic domain-containing protein [Solirubrobacteraceae bacterium]
MQQQLTFIKRGEVQWREAPLPALQNAGEVLVRPIAVATCDLDAAIVRGQAPFVGPFAMGHEFVAEVTDVGDAVAGVRPGERYAVPFQICCGSCANCRAGLTDSCLSAAPLAMYGLGPVGGDWGGAFSDLVRVPFPDFMLVPIPEGVNPLTVASVSDNIPDAWRAVAPPLAGRPGADVLIVGGEGAVSISLYACQIARVLGAARVDYVDHDAAHLQLAAALGANPIEADGPEQDGPYSARFPRRLGPYPITVDASAHPDGLALAVRSTAPGGTCTAVGIFYEQYTRMPLLEMYSTGVTFHHGRVPARAAMPAILQLIADGGLDPTPVTTRTATWSDAAEALAEAPVKLVVTRD